MMKTCPDHETLSAYADHEGDDLAAVERHLESCAACRGVLAEIVAVDRSLRREARAIECPPDLLRWIERRRRLESAPRVRRRAPSRREALIGGGALIGGVAAAAAGMAVFLPSEESADHLAPALFRDFAKRGLGEQSMDIASSDLRDLQSWFDARLPFIAPRLPALAEIGVRGGRLCWLVGRRIAAFHLGTGAGQDPAGWCLYAAVPDGLTLTEDEPLPARGRAVTVLRDGAAAGAFWADELAFALIGVAPSEEIGAFAETLRAV